MVEKCTECGSTDTIKYGKRETRHGKKPLFYCNECGAKFVEPGFKDKSYPGRVILAALKNYAQGFSLEESSKKVNQRFKVNSSRNTVYNWVKEYRSVCKLLGSREKYVQNHKPKKIIKENTYFHSNVEYPYRLHQGKLRLAEKHGFQKLTQFLENVDSEINHKWFEKGLRSSEVDHGFREEDQYNIIEKEGFLDCKIADLALKANTNRNKRHDSVQDLMLKADKATVGTEVPVWYYDKKLEDTVTGHIDVLQVRKNKIYILDYKPKAGSVEPLGQLRSYVKGLSYRTGISEDRFRAAWFNTDVYKEISFQN